MSGDGERSAQNQARCETLTKMAMAMPRTSGENRSPRRAGVTTRGADAVTAEGQTEETSVSHLASEDCHPRSIGCGSLTSTEEPEDENGGSVGCKDGAELEDDVGDERDEDHRTTAVHATQRTPRERANDVASDEQLQGMKEGARVSRLFKCRKRTLSGAMTVPED